MSALRIAIDARLAGRDFTGDSTYWTGLLRGLSELDSTFEYLLFSNAEKPPEIPESHRFRWIRLKSRHSRWWSLVSFPLAARRERANAIHTQYNLSPLAGRHGITTIHDVSFLIGPEWFKPRDLFLLKKFVPASAGRAAKVMTVSETSKEEIERLIPQARGKTSWAHLGPNPSICAVDRSFAEEAVKQLGVEGPYLLTVGTRWPRKNMRLAIDAVKSIGGRLPHRLVLTGKSGWGEDEDREGVVRTGYVSYAQLSALYSAADLYLAPSFHEGFGLTLLEAFACGCPVVFSSGGAMPEVAGYAGRLVPSWEAEAWARSIEELLSDSSKLESMRESGLRRVKEFSWRRCAEVHEMAYREAAE